MGQGASGCPWSPLAGPEAPVTNRSYPAIEDALTLAEIVPAEPEKNRPPEAAGAALAPRPEISVDQVLQILGGVLWRARLEPFEIVECSGGNLAASDSRSPFAALLTPDTVRRWESLIYPPDLPVFQRAVADYAASQPVAAPIDYRIIIRDGELLWLRQWLLKKTPPDASGRTEVSGLVRIVSEEKRLQWEVMRTSENERCRLGQEIHDDVCQILAGINYLTHVLHQRLQAAQPAEAKELELINHEIQAGLERTRALAHGLLPAKSDFNTLSQALRNLARQVHTRFGIQLTVKLPAKPPAFSQEHLLHLYRIVQEASSNSFKHGRASQVEVSLALHDGCPVLTIADNGPGLPTGSSRVEGVGLNVMRNRAELLGGRIEFGNSSRGGARVQVYLPQSTDT
jgi:signal transduction histidine kinase